MPTLELKPTHKPVHSYYAALRQFEELGVRHETAVRSAFQNLLDHCARKCDWTLVPEWEIRRPRKHPLRVDGALVDNFRRIGQVITVSLETVKIVKGLPPLEPDKSDGA